MAENIFQYSVCPSISNVRVVEREISNILYQALFFLLKISNSAGETAKASANRQILTKAIFR
jgi:hypothetical protein